MHLCLPLPPLPSSSLVHRVLLLCMCSSVFFHFPPNVPPSCHNLHSSQSSLFMHNAIASVVFLKPPSLPAYIEKKLDEASCSGYPPLPSSLYFLLIPKIMPLYTDKKLKQLCLFQNRFPHHRHYCSSLLHRRGNRILGFLSVNACMYACMYVAYVFCLVCIYLRQET